MKLGLSFRNESKRCSCICISYFYLDYLDFECLTYPNRMLRHFLIDPSFIWPHYPMALPGSEGWVANMTHYDCCCRHESMQERNPFGQCTPSFGRPAPILVGVMTPYHQMHWSSDITQRPVSSESHSWNQDDGLQDMVPYKLTIIIAVRPFLHWSLWTPRQCSSFVQVATPCPYWMWSSLPVRKSSSTTGSGTWMTGAATSPPSNTLHLSRSSFSTTLVG